MDFTRTRGTDWFAGLGGLLVLVALFLPWYGFAGAVTASGWEALSVIDVVLAIFAATALAVPFVTAARDSPAVPLVVTIAAFTLGVLAVLLVVIRVIWTPASVAAGIEFGAVEGNLPTVGREWGVWVGLVATLLAFWGAYRALRDDRAPSLRPAPTPARMPAPPAAG